ncbi:MAG: VOC family protein [Paracoccaceae bacterium]
MKIEKIHHVAYRCKDAKETVEWYRDMLGMDFILCHRREPRALDPRARSPHAHLPRRRRWQRAFAFFELPTKPEMGRDPNTPKWVQHIAFKVKDRQICSTSRRISKPTASKRWASPTIRSSIRSISSIPAATGSNSPVRTRRKRRCWPGSTTWREMLEEWSRTKQRRAMPTGCTRRNSSDV